MLNFGQEEKEEQPQDHYEKGRAYSLESLCMSCYKQGVTKFLMTEIPFYGEIVLSSFVCDFCAHRDTQITSAKALAQKTKKFILHVDPVMCEAEDVMIDLSRTLVRTDSTIVKIPELGFEIPANRAEVNTVEGFLLNVRESLSFQQEQRKYEDPVAYEKIQGIVEKLELMQNGEENFTLELYDPAGHCFVTNPYAPALDPRCKEIEAERSAEEYVTLGYQPEQAADFFTKEELDQKQAKDDLLSRAIGDMRKREAKKQRQLNPRGKLVAQDGYKTGGSKSGLNVMSSNLLKKKDLDKFEHLSDQAQSSMSILPQSCSGCRRTAVTKICVLEVPYFGETIVMATTCDHCGYKSTDVRTAQSYGDKGIKITVSCKAGSEDLSRDVLKSADSGISIPELGLELPTGVLGAKFTSIEGILLGIYDQVKGQLKFYEGDSESGGLETKLRVQKFISDLQACIDGELDFTFVLDDPAGNSFIEGRALGIYDSSPFEDDNMNIEYYSRTLEQEDELGLLHMKTTGFETIHDLVDAEETDDDDDEEDEELDEEDDEEETEECSQEEAAKEEAKAQTPE